MTDFWRRGKPNVPKWIQASSSNDGTSQAPTLAEQSEATLVDFPRHLYPPENVKTLDIRINRAMAIGDVFNLIDFQPNKLGIMGAVYITHYAIFNDGLLEADYSFLPTINGLRIYPYHGNPQNTRNPGNFLISLGLAPDLANYALIPGFVVMNPEDRLVWQATNGSAVITDMGVRVVGYVDQSAIRVTQNYGG